MLPARECLVDGALARVRKGELAMHVHVVGVELYGALKRFDGTSEVPFHLSQPSDSHEQKAAPG